ncbi:MAG: hypothetical protein DDT42_02124 [candidate division WS2 bacterium]|uniref:Uncharacterized protein n=1 Tax=Psychracetigena formicireducens TaxID=2986056 RepID=A0A9E2BJ80_PSYF1|nr:hypothetical protein [Candidatus Psychracetigena formicireducens]
MYFIAFPKGTPTEIVNRFTDALEQVSKMDDFNEEMADFMQTPFFVRGAEARNILENQQAEIMELEGKLIPGN